MKISIQESLWTPSRINTKELFNKFLKAQHRGKTLKASRGKKRHIANKIAITPTSVFSKEIMEARRQWNNIYKMVKD